ncbi:MAG: 30S ribosomal protein S21 [Bacteroidetes bacterium]|jgi:small subunit ribosomal protein S21|nr:30S ribosomal protein S21 [Bacteroidota bacterium]MBX7237923.1 30S ribosomal protein S21 [Bacteroidia bacterium]MCC7515016.1 30S ribosomal protein S21 [Bacteroidia bacterium]MCW5919008.1 30S ribosomal protein S21 [Bacteroidota bacterium]HCI58532.1 30S ribosomal protein S21 [Bacteroidota bacterium]
MIIVQIKDNEPLDKALKKFKKKFEKTGVVKQLRSRQAYEKPSVARRTEVKKAIHRTKLQRLEAEGAM